LLARQALPPIINNCVVNRSTDVALNRPTHAGKDVHRTINVYRALIDELHVDSIVEHLTKIAAARLAGGTLL
jgi:hypothetical protein